MANINAQAPVAFSATTAATGTASQLFQVSAAGVTAGLTAGNFYLDSPSSNLLNGQLFTVTAAGWVKAHGATQKMGIGLQVFPWNTSVAGAKTATGTETFIMTPSATLTSGTYYDFVIQQKFFGEANANTLTCFAPTVYFAGSLVTISATLPAAITVAFASASQTEPITGVNNTYNYPLASFGIEFYNTVSDTTETMALTSFNLQGQI
jgi:hypothetical protein